MTNRMPRLNVSEARSLLLRFGSLVAAYYRAKYPEKTAENIAADIGQCVRQGERIAAGRPPTMRVVVVMVVREGLAFVRKTIHPLCERGAEWRIRRRAEAIEQQIKRERDGLAMRPDLGLGRLAGIGCALASTGRASLRGVIGKLSLRRKETA